jgi:3D (Asp-Asp-Asp) domain-containing protein/predicted  nucleic acid-binding Zn-ribbon protein
VFVLVGVSVATAARPGASLERDVTTLQARTHRALLELYALDSRLHAVQARLSTLERDAQRLRAEEAVLAQRIGATRRTLAVSQQQLGQNLNTLYKQGDVNAFAIVLGAESLDDALTKLDALSRVTDETQRIVGVATDARLRLVDLRASLDARQSSVAAALADARLTANALVAARSERLGFVSDLRREQRLKTAQIAALQAAAARVARKSNGLQTAAVSAGSAAQTGEAAAPPAVPAALATLAGARTITVYATGYAIRGTTATGMPVGYGVVAVDPSVIPLGTRLTIPGYGEGVAADTGGGVRGATIDLWFPTLAEARAWGGRTVTITLH